MFKSRFESFQCNGNKMGYNKNWYFLQLFKAFILSMTLYLSNISRYQMTICDPFQPDIFQLETLIFKTTVIRYAMRVPHWIIYIDINFIKIYGFSLKKLQGRVQKIENKDYLLHEIQYIWTEIAPQYVPDYSLVITKCNSTKRSS